MCLTAIGLLAGCLMTYRWLEHPFFKSSAPRKPRLEPIISEPEALAAVGQG